MIEALLILSLAGAFEVRFTGEAAVSQLCACLLDARRIAESHGRLDFTADVAFADTRGPIDVTARIWMGSAHAVGRIDFAGHGGINDSTLRRAMLLYEREAFDVGKLRQSLARINGLGLFEPLTLGDITVTRRDDGVTADVTIPLREQRRRWWQLSAPSWQASIGARLPPWGRGVLDASTYVVRLNVLGFFAPVAKAVPLFLERPVVPGQELLSGFAISPTLSPRAMLSHYGRSQLTRGIHAVLDEEVSDALAVPVTSRGPTDNDLLVCEPPKPRLRWLRRGALIAAELLLSAF